MATGGKRVQKKAAGDAGAVPARGGRTAVRLVGESQAGTRPAMARRTEGQSKRGEGVGARILSAAPSCFSSFGFAGTSPRGVADRAAVTPTLVLYHFPTHDFRSTPPL